MGLLDDVKQLADDGLPCYISETPEDGYQPFCYLCNERMTEHVPSCSLAVMPRIVAALEAAERCLPILNDVCPAAGCERHWNLHGLHDDDCVIGHLVVVMQSEKVTA